MNQPLIVWEKWIDPFGRDEEEEGWRDYEDKDEESDNQDTMPPRPNNNITVIASPMGLIPYNEYTASSKIFNFWLGHTNFNISIKLAELIETCSGVEILDIFTRYRFRIAIGKCFNDSETMKSINDILYSFLEKSDDTK